MNHVKLFKRGGDLLVTAPARSRGANLVTANLHEFRRVPDLNCIGWTRAARSKKR